MAVKIEYRKLYRCDAESDRDLAWEEHEALIYTIDTDKWWKIESGVFIEVDAEDIYFKGPIEVTDINISGTPDGSKFLRDDGAWAEPSGGGGSGTPGGSDTQVQFNDAGAFGGDAGMTYDKTTNTLTIEQIENDMLTYSYLRSLTQMVW